MKKKVIWLMLSWLIVAALVLASCAKEEVVAPGEEEEEEEEVVAPGEEEEEEEEEEPQYGGTLTFMIYSSDGSDLHCPDPGAKQYDPNEFLQALVQERLVMGDFEKYGPRGTGEYAFELCDVVPEKYVRGWLLESWDVSLDKAVLHVRPGIYWHGDKPWVMEARELTAEDVAAALMYRRSLPSGTDLKDFTSDIYAEGRYTVIIEFTDFTINWLYVVGTGLRGSGSMFPPELLVAGGDKWENQVGTGPFYFKEYAIGSHLTYERNPNYWKTTTINGVEYQLPFVDKMIGLIMPDASTQVAALRTGVVDYDSYVDATNWSSLHETNPELLMATTGGWGEFFVLKTTDPPFDNVDVRRAMMIATNMEDFQALWGIGPLESHWWPVYHGDPSVYTPLEELPADIRILYDYNPELAREMLADAGYPDGFAIDFYTQDSPATLDRAALLKDMWAKVDVEVTIKAFDRISLTDILINRTYHYLLPGGSGVGDPVESLVKYTTGHISNHALWSNERYDELVAQMTQEPDVDKRNVLIREASLILLREAAYIPTSPQVLGHWWWPWVKNYYGEGEVSYSDCLTLLSHVWIDQDLKAEMGY